MAKANIKQLAEDVANAALVEVTKRAAAAAASGGWRAALAALKSTTLWTSVGIAGLQGLGLFGVIDPQAAGAATILGLASIAVERIKKL
jgi:hypothetical protein